MRHGLRGVLRVVTLAALTVAAAAPVGAEESGDATVCPVCSQAGHRAPSYPTKAGLTLLRGAANMLLGWTELFRQPVKAAEQHENVLTGVARGVGSTVTRTAAGLGEVLTFWTPKTKDGYVHFANDCPICMGKK